MTEVVAVRPTGWLKLRVALFAASVSAVLLFATPAAASTIVGYDLSSGLIVSGGPEASALLEVKVTGGSFDVVEASNPGINGSPPPPTVSADKGCTQIGPNEAQCSLGSGPNKVTASMGGGNDVVDVQDGVGPATVNGDDGDDILIGGPAGDTLNGGPGSDSLNGEEGPDTANGDDGADALLGFVNLGPGGGPETTPAPDVWNGGAGEDSIDFRAAQVPINVSLDGQANDGRTGEGDNVLAVEDINGGQAADILTGDDGPNVIGGRASNSGCESPGTGVFLPDTDADVINGNGGNDILGGCGGNDQISAGAGDDIVKGGNGADTINGGDGNDQLDENASALFSLDTAPGADAVNGGDGADIVKADGGQDVLDAGAGNDRVQYGSFITETGSGTGFTAHGGTGNDLITGGPLRDNLSGDDGDDGVFGGNENDVVSGGNGNDRLGGDGLLTPTVGNDSLIGGGGDDRLGVTLNSTAAVTNADNDPGADSMNGGTGQDVIISREATGTPVASDKVVCGNELSSATVDNDAAFIDLQDRVEGCENLNSAPVGEVIQIRLLSHKASVTRGGNVEVKIHCAKTAHGRCVGHADVAVAGRRSGASRHYSLARGATETLELQLRGRDVGAARRGKRVEVTLVEPGGIGPHTVIRTLPTVALE